MKKNKPSNPATSLSSFFRYLKGKMTHGEQHNLERRLLNDPFEADALEGFSQHESSRVEDDIRRLREKLPSNPSLSSSGYRWRHIGIAASVVLILGLAFVLILLKPDKAIMVSEDLHAPRLEQQMADSHKSNAPAPDSQSLRPTMSRQGPSGVANNTTIEDEEEMEIAAEKIQENTLTITKPLIIPGDSQPEHEPLPPKSARLTRAGISPGSKLKTAHSRPVNDTIDTIGTPLTGTIKGIEIKDASMQVRSSGYKTIEGVVMNKHQQPVSGASIRLKGTSHTTIASSDGSYKLSFPTQDSSLPVLAVSPGYKPEETVQLSRDSINFILDDEWLSITETTAVHLSEEKLRRLEAFIPAEPAIGMKNYIETIEHSLVFPADGSGKNATVTALIFISEQGHITDIKITRSPGPSFSLEVVKRIKETSFWNPATRYGLPVSDKVKIKLRFQPGRSSDE